MPTTPIFIEREHLIVFEGGYFDFLNFLEEEPWKLGQWRAIACHFSFTGRWYLFTPRQMDRGQSRFFDLALEDRTEFSLKDVFDVHEYTGVPDVAPGVVADKPVVVLSQQACVGAWLPREVIAAGTRGNKRGKPPMPIAPTQTEPEPLRRTPHMDFESWDEFAPDGSFAVFVYADEDALRPGESGEDIVISDPERLAEYALTVVLSVSDNLEIVGIGSQTLTLIRDEPLTKRVEFSVRVSPTAKDGDKGAVTAAFSYKGRPCGRITRGMTVGHGLGDHHVRDFTGPISLDATAQEPDLTITITCPDKAEDRYVVCVRTPHLADYALGVAKPWPLGKAAEQVVGDCMENFVRRSLSPKQRRDALLGAGKRLFRATPEHFRDVWWRLVREGKVPKTVYIVSEEPHIPWELMVPDDAPAALPPLDWKPLGVECSVGRWVHEGHASPPQDLRATSSYVIAPQYTGSKPAPLAKSAEEREMVSRLFAGEAVEPVVYDTLTDRIAAEPRPLLHFACHGASPTAKTEQMLYLEQDGTLSSNEVFGSADFKKACSQAHPMVFLNACQVGRIVPDISGIGGFATTFIALGASCVIAPIWSVRDGVAHEVASTIYTTICDAAEAGNLVPPVAEILRGIRALAYSGAKLGEDTFAAYCFYGDPFFTLRPPVLKKLSVEP